MKRVFTILLVISTITLFGQELKKIKENENYGKATYYVLTSDMKTKHGTYSIKGYTGKELIVEGNYNHGKKDGIWTERYYLKGRNLKSQGEYKDDNQAGIWTFYNSDGEIVQKYDYDAKKLIMSTECGLEKEFEIIIDDKLVKSKLDCPPSYIGGYSLLVYETTQEIVNSFDFPVNEKGRTIITVDTVVSMILNKDGNIENIEFSKPIEYENLDEFIEKKIADKKEKWLIAELNGEKVSAKINIPIKIKIMY